MLAFKKHFSLNSIIGRQLNHSESLLGNICIISWMSKEFFRIEAPKSPAFHEFLQDRVSDWAMVGFKDYSYDLPLFYTFWKHFSPLVTPRLCWVDGDEYLPVIIWINNERKLKTNPFVKESLTSEAQIGSLLFLFISVGFTWHLETI